MRHDEADKAQEPDHGDGTGRQERRDRRQQQAREFHAQSEAFREFIAELQDIQMTSREKRQHAAGERIRQSIATCGQLLAESPPTIHMSALCTRSL